MDKNKSINIGILGPCPLPHGGVTRIIENNTKYWKEIGCETYLVPYGVPKMSKPPEGVEFINWRTVPMGKFPPMVEFFKAVVRFPFFKWHKIFSYNRALRHIIEEKNIDVLYAHHTDKMGLSAVLQSKHLGIPAVIVAYGQTWLVDKYDNKIRRLQKYVLKNASWVVSTSEHCKKGALRLGSDSEKTSVIYAGIDLDKFRPGLNKNLFREKHNISKDAVVISILGLALRRKLDVILQAIEYLKDIPNRVILIGGTGTEFHFIKSYVESLKKDFVRVLGFIEEKELPYFYAATDVFVTAPKTLIECMGLSMKEAMACGVPVVGANIGGIPEAITHGETGLLFENNNAEDLATQVKRLVGDNGLKDKISFQGRMFVEKTFNLRTLAIETTDLFFSLLN